MQLPIHPVVHGTAGVAAAAAVAGIAAVRLARAVCPGLFAYLSERLRVRAAIQLARSNPRVRIEITKDGLVITPDLSDVAGMAASTPQQRSGASVSQTAEPTAAADGRTDPAGAPPSPEPVRAAGPAAG